MVKHTRSSLCALIALLLFFGIVFMVNTIQEEPTTEEVATEITISQQQEVEQEVTTTKRKKVKALMLKLDDVLTKEEAHHEEDDTEIEAETEESRYETEAVIEETQYEAEEEKTAEWQGQVLTAYLGTIQGPSGKETYYNLPMGGVVSIMRDLGYDEEQYPYWVREDGCKMLGEYIIVAANLDIRPRGTILETSLGWAIVCDTGGFAQYNQTQVDIAVDW